MSSRCPLWVKSRHRSVSAQCPLYPQKRNRCDAAKRAVFWRPFLLWQLSGLFQTRFERGEKARCFTSGDGAMIEGEGQRQHAVDDLLIIVDDHTPLSAAGTDDGHLGRNNNKARKAAANHSKI